MVFDIVAAQWMFEAKNNAPRRLKQAWKPIKVARSPVSSTRGAKEVVEWTLGSLAGCILYLSRPCEDDIYSGLPQSFPWYVCVGSVWYLTTSYQLLSYELFLHNFMNRTKCPYPVRNKGSPKY
jgi:hypothetical protein